MPYNNDSVLIRTYKDGEAFRFVAFKDIGATEIKTASTGNAYILLMFKVLTNNMKIEEGTSCKYFLSNEFLYLFNQVNPVTGTFYYKITKGHIYEIARFENGYHGIINITAGETQYTCVHIAKKGEPLGPVAITYRQYVSPLEQSMPQQATTRPAPQYTAPAPVPTQAPAQPLDDFQKAMAEKPMSDVAAYKAAIIALVAGKDKVTVNKVLSEHIRKRLLNATLIAKSIFPNNDIAASICANAALSLEDFINKQLIANGKDPFELTGQEFITEVENKVEEEANNISAPKTEDDIPFGV